MKIVGAAWVNNLLTIELNHFSNPTWIWAMRNMGSHTSVMGKGPENFQFNGNKVSIYADENEAQRIIDYFKGWLPNIAQVYKSKIERDIREAEQKERNELKQRLSEEEKRLRVNTNLKF
jgi:hypothetical protein